MIGKIIFGYTHRHTDAVQRKNEFCSLHLENKTVFSVLHRRKQRRACRRSIIDELPAELVILLRPDQNTESVRIAQCVSLPRGMRIGCFSEENADPEIFTKKTAEVFHRKLKFRFFGKVDGIAEVKTAVLCL